MEKELVKRCGVDRVTLRDDLIGDSYLATVILTTLGRSVKRVDALGILYCPW